MKELKFRELIAYAMAFVSFVFPKIQGIKEIMLFGSAARGEAAKDSDIDLFFDLENEKEEEIIKPAVKEELNRFYKSKVAEIWHLKGIKNPISINVGNLDKWKLKRSMISEGISLFSKYKEIPKSIKGFVYFNIGPIKNVAKRNKIIRGLFGRKEKGYYSNGILEEVSGKKLSPSSFLVQKENADKVINFLNNEKVSYKFFELWTDQII